jgi:hypothetical protein
VEGKLFTGSFDGSIKVWDVTGIKDDTTFGTNNDRDGKDQQTDIDKLGEGLDKNQNGINNDKIMID